nr:GNAT family N-acetyltransferase [Hymenobacter sp. CRA2]
MVAGSGRAGYSAVSFLALIKRNAWCGPEVAQVLEIERIYVLKAYHGQQVGQVLYDKAVEVAAQARAKYV